MSIAASKGGDQRQRRVQGGRIDGQSVSGPRRTMTPPARRGSTPPKKATVNAETVGEEKPLPHLAQCLEMTPLVANTSTGEAQTSSPPSAPSDRVRARLSSIALANTWTRKSGAAPEGEPKRLSSSRQAETSFPEPQRRTTRLASVKKSQSEDYGPQSAKKASFFEDPDTLLLEPAQAQAEVAAAAKKQKFKGKQSWNSSDAAKSPRSMTLKDLGRTQSMPVQPSLAKTSDRDTLLYEPDRSMAAELEALTEAADQETMRVGDTMVICKVGSSKAGLQVEVLQLEWHGMVKVSLAGNKVIPRHGSAASSSGTSASARAAQRHWQ